jgi:hypothetical protein
MTKRLLPLEAAIVRMSVIPHWRFAHLRPQSPVNTAITNLPIARPKEAKKALDSKWLVLLGPILGIVRHGNAQIGRS